MNSDSLGRWLIHSRLALLIAFSGLLCLGQAHAPGLDPDFVDFMKHLQQEAANAEVQVALGGNLKDFRIQIGGASNQSSRSAQQDQLRQAAAKLSGTLKANPNAEAHFDLSLILAKLDDLRSAREELESAVRQDPNMAQAHNQLGIHALASGDTTKAEHEFKTAISIDSQFVEARNNLGLLYAHEGRDSEAIELLREAIEQRPAYAQAHLNLGLVLAGEGKSAEAEKEFRNALRAFPNSEGASTALAMTALGAGRGEQAIDILQRVAQVHPQSALAHLNLGIALAGDGFDLPGALEQFSEATRLDPDSAAAHYNKGRLLYDLNRRLEARAELDTAHRLRPDYREALYLLAQIEKQLGNIQQSAELLDHLLTLQPSNPDAQYMLGQNLLLLGRTDDAIRHLRIAVELNPKALEPLYSLAQALTKAGKPEAKSYMDRFQQMRQQQDVDNRVQQLGSYGLEAANVHDWPQAVADFKEAIELCGECASIEDLHRNLGLIYVLKGELAAGKHELETALQIRPGDPEARRALESLGNREAAPK